MKKQLTEMQKKADKDINIILYATLIPLLIYMIFGNNLMSYATNTDFNLWIRFIPILLLQFGLAGLGSLIVILYRKEKICSYGISKDNLLKTIFLSILVCIPTLIWILLTEESISYLPFKGCFATQEILNSSFPTNIIGYLLTALVWGFFEGFNYVVLSKKINDRYATKNKLLNIGAFVCSIACILIHGMIGFDLKTILGAITMFILIYGMLTIKDKTNNAWGCILIFILFWNAI